MHMTQFRALAIVSVLAVAALVLAVFTITRDDSGPVQITEKCKPGQIPVSLEPPESEAEVKINVFNATQSAGLATSVANEFRNRRFNVATVGDEQASGQPAFHPDDVAILRYGPKAIGGAYLLRAYFLNEAKGEFDINREDDVVDVVIGGEFKQLATPTEMRQAVALIGRPELPPGTCEG